MGWKLKLDINRRVLEVAAPPDTPLLWVIREEAGLIGTKYGCGQALCGACTVHVDGNARRSCVTACGDVEGKAITTIEGLRHSDGTLHAVQQAWIEENVVQCGYCQAGQIMAAAALLAKKPKPTDAEIDAVMSANLCRCGTYPRIRKAIHRAASILESVAPQSASPQSAAPQGAAAPARAAK